MKFKGGAPAADSLLSLSQTGPGTEQEGQYKRKSTDLCVQPGRAPRDQDVPCSEVVSLEHSVAVDLWGGSRPVPGVWFRAAKSSLSSASRSKPSASKLCGAQTQSGNAPLNFGSEWGKCVQLGDIL